MVAEQNHAYSLVDDKESLDGLEQGYTQYRKQSPSIAKILILASLVSNAFLAGYIAYTSWQPRPSPAWSILGDSPTYPVRYHHISNYSSPAKEEDQEISMRWADMTASHGVVALDHTWAAAQGLSPSWSLPSDDTKGIYLIDAYHSLHCIQEIRRSWHGLWNYRLNPSGEQVENYFELPHYSHCFDYLLRSMICNPSDHLFSNTKKNQPGDGEVRQCRDWRVIRDWATAHSACDVNDVNNENPYHLGLPDLCHGKDDLVPHGIDTV